MPRKQQRVGHGLAKKLNQPTWLAFQSLQWVISGAVDPPFEVMRLYSTLLLESTTIVASRYLLLPRLAHAFRPSSAQRAGPNPGGRLRTMTTLGVSNNGVDSSDDDLSRWERMYQEGE